MRVFIDFDDVIFNTKKFKENFRSMFIANGVCGDIFDKYYNDPLDKRAVKTFDPWKQIDNINKNIGVDVEHLTDLVNAYIADMSEYIFSDVNNFVEFVKKGNIYIVSFGEIEFQTKKILNSGIKKNIPNIFIVDSSKAKVIGEILEKEKIDFSENIFFLDDRIEQIRDVKENFPEIISILVKRPEGRYQEMQKENCCDYEVHNLKEAEKIILARLSS